MATHGNRRATSFTRVASGVASLEPDRRRERGWTLLVDGVPQSYVDLADPTYLAFSYVRRLATVLRLAAPAAVPLKVLHLGGGTLTLPRWVAATRPGSVQTVVERDALLLALVSRALPWPAAVEVVVGDAREFTDAGPATWCSRPPARRRCWTSGGSPVPWRRTPSRRASGTARN